MNKRDREQLRASIAKDLVQGQGENSATRELLRQYAPLQGVVSQPTPRNPVPSGVPEPVENSMAPRATVARDDDPAWHGATVAQHATAAPGATLAQYAVVKGELRVPNTINFSLFPTLDPFAKAVYYQLFFLSHGFRRDTCLVGLAKLAKFGPHVPAKGPKHNHLSRKARIDKKARIQTWRAVARQSLPGTGACRLHGTRCHRGTEGHPGTQCRRGTTDYRGIRCHPGTRCQQ